MSIAAYYADLYKAAGLWRDQADELGAVRTSIDEVDTSLLGSRVGTAASSFLVTWGDQVEGLASTASTNGSAIASFATGFGVLDDDIADRLQGLVPVGVETEPPSLSEWLG